MRYLLLILLLLPAAVLGQFEQRVTHFRDSLKMEHPINKVIVKKKFKNYHEVAVSIQMDSFMCSKVTDTAWMCNVLYVAVRKTYAYLSGQIGRLIVEFMDGDTRLYYCECYPEDKDTYIMKKECWFYIVKDHQKQIIQ